LPFQTSLYPSFLPFFCPTPRLRPGPPSPPWIITSFRNQHHEPGSSYHHDILEESATTLTITTAIITFFVTAVAIAAIVLLSPPLPLPPPPLSVLSPSHEIRQDIIEEIIGDEIIDETDVYIDIDKVGMVVVVVVEGMKNLPMLEGGDEMRRWEMKEGRKMGDEERKEGRKEEPSHA
jgi:hypothetical protein